MPQMRIGPNWLVDRLPDQLARFFDRIDGSTAIYIELLEALPKDRART